MDEHEDDDFQIDPETGECVDKQIDINDPKYKAWRDESRKRMDRNHKAKFLHLTLQHRCSHPHDDKSDMPVFYSYRQLRDFLNSLTDEQLSQQVQILPQQNGSIDKPIGLEVVIGAGTVEEFLHVEGDPEPIVQTHSNIDWKHHPEQVVLASDGHG
jgi:hypothetical protein